MKIISFLRKRIRPKILHNVYKRKKPKKKAMLGYLVEPFLISNKSAQFRIHYNRKTNILLAEALDKCGYSVDIINYNDIESAKKISENYDLLLGLGLAFEYLVKEKPELFKKKIYFATGAPAEYQNSREQERINYVNNKYKSQFNLVRKVSEDNRILDAIDYVLILGTEYSKSLFANTTTTESEIISGHVSVPEKFKLEKKEWKTAKKKFLFLTGSGKILCGLDLLIEIFSKNQDLELYLCGGFNGEEDFLSLFKTKLEKSPNIHLEGWVDTSSVEFHSIVRKCGAIIMPVVSSGINGSVLIGMSYGLIPILSKDCNVDIGGNGIMFEDISEESIENAIGEYVKHDNKWFSKTSKAIFEFTSKEYSEKNFKENLNKIFKKWNL